MPFESEEYVDLDYVDLEKFQQRVETEEAFWEEE